MQVNMSGGSFRGRWVVEKGNKHGTNLRLEFDNVVLNVGRVYMFSRFNQGSDGTVNNTENITPPWLYLGTGTTEPQTTDLGLQSVSSLAAMTHQPVESSSNYQRISAIENVGGRRLRFDYGEGVAQGTWTELGLAWQSTYTNPYNRSLFRDESGNPIALTVLADEWLRIWINIEQYLPIPASKAGQILVNGVPRNYTISYANLDDIWTRAFALRFMLIGSTGNNASSISVDSWNNGTQTVNYATRTVTWTVSVAPGAKRNFTSVILQNASHTSMWHATLIWTFETPIIAEADEKTDFQISLTYSMNTSVWSDGIATGGTLSTLVDNKKAWTVNEHVGRNVYVYAGNNYGQTREITGNTADTLTVTPDWTVAPNSTTRYEVI